MLPKWARIGRVFFLKGTAECHSTLGVIRNIDTAIKAIQVEWFDGNSTTVYSYDWFSTSCVPSVDNANPIDTLLDTLDGD